MIIIVTALGRAIICMLGLDGIDFEGLRSYDPTSFCHDTQPYHGILLLLIGVVIDVLPSFIFTCIFGALDRRTSENIEQTLFSAMQSEESGL
jgi:phosphotransferase system  glucose/maltose/N-acetylglucosamine-specific IIC component